MKKIPGEGKDLAGFQKNVRMIQGETYLSIGPVQPSQLCHALSSAMPLLSHTHRSCLSQYLPLAGTPLAQISCSLQVPSAHPRHPELTRDWVRGTPSGPVLGQEMA